MEEQIENDWKSKMEDVLDNVDLSEKNTAYLRKDIESIVEMARENFRKKAEEAMPMTNSHNLSYSIGFDDCRNQALAAIREL